MTIRLKNSKTEKDWYLDLVGEDMDGVNAVSVVVRDASTDEVVADVVTFYPYGTIEASGGARDAMLDAGYDTCGWSFDCSGAVEVE